VKNLEAFLAILATIFVDRHFAYLRNIFKVNRPEASNIPDRAATPFALGPLASWSPSLYSSTRSRMFISL
jgi:hypothetical protein